MKKICLSFFLIFSLACAKVSVETKEPIKVDVSMRIDVYQHVVRDIDAIEDQIYGNDSQQLNFIWGMEEAYASDLPGKVAEAISRRKARAGTIETYLSLGYLGINRAGYLEVMEDKVPAGEKALVYAAASEENNDRKITNAYTAEKNRVPLSQVEEVMAKDSFKRVPAGTWLEVYDQAGGSYIWKQK